MLEDSVLRAGEPVVGVRLQGGELPRQPREVAGSVPGNVLRVLRSHLRHHRWRYSSMLASASSRLRTPRSVEILPSVFERDLPATSPALPVSRTLAFLAYLVVSSTTSRTVWPSGRDAAKRSSRPRYASRSERS